MRDEAGCWLGDDSAPSVGKWTFIKPAIAWPYVLGLLDYGATCSGMPEHVALSIISHALQSVTDGTYSKEAIEYPIVRMHKCIDDPNNAEMY